MNVNLLLILVISCAIVVVFDAVGSILSRRLNFKYTWLAIGSIIIYGSTAILSVKHGALINGIISSFIVGLFDAVVGIRISKKLNANVDEIENFSWDISMKMVISVSLFAAIIGGVSILIFV